MAHYNLKDRDTSTAVDSKVWDNYLLLMSFTSSECSIMKEVERVLYCARCSRPWFESHIGRPCAACHSPSLCIPISCFSQLYDQVKARSPKIYLRKEKDLLKRRLTSIKINHPSLTFFLLFDYRTSMSKMPSKQILNEKPARHLPES